MTRTQKDTQTGEQSPMGSPKTTQASTFILMSVQTHSGGSHKKVAVAATSEVGNQGTQDHLERRAYISPNTLILFEFVLCVSYFTQKKSA